MPMLILVNGAPDAGKSTLARRYVESHPLALLLDIDELRTMLGGWREHTESR
jgi:predicted kinase